MWVFFYDKNTYLIHRQSRAGLRIPTYVLTFWSSFFVFFYERLVLSIFDAIPIGLASDTVGNNMLTDSMLQKWLQLQLQFLKQRESINDIYFFERSKLDVYTTWSLIFLKLLADISEALSLISNLMCNLCVIIAFGKYKYNLLEI